MALGAPFLHEHAVVQASHAERSSIVGGEQTQFVESRCALAPLTLQLTQRDPARVSAFLLSLVVVYAQTRRPTCSFQNEGKYW